MRPTMEQIVGQLLKDARPVRRLRPPLLRAAFWLLAILGLAGLAILLFSNLEVFGRRAHDPKLDLELLGTLLTGITAVVAAFHLSLPDRPAAWALLPLPPFLLWIAASGYNCYRHWIVFGPSGWELGESVGCFKFILGLSLPLGISLLAMLRRARPLAPVPVAAMGGLGVAAIAAFVLQFFHPFDVTFMDLALHGAAVGAVVALSSGAGRFSARSM